MVTLNSVVPGPSTQLPLDSGALDRAIDLAQGTKSGKDDAKSLMKVSREFESIFLNMMLKEMRSAVPKFDPLNSYAQDTYQEMMDQEWTKDMVKNKSMGLADMVYRQLSKLESGPTR